MSKLSKFIRFSILILVISYFKCGDDSVDELIFAGGFESGTLFLSEHPAGDWHHSTEGNGTIAVTSTEVHSEDWAAEVIITDTTDPNHFGAFVRRKDLQTGNSIYARTYFRLKSGHNFLDQEYRYFNIIWIGNNILEEVCSFRIVNLGGKIKLKFCYYYDEEGVPTFATHETSFEINDDVWYYVELATLQDDNNGEFRAWAGQSGVVPTEIISITGIDTNIPRSVECFCIGVNINANNALGTIYFDDYALDDTRINITNN